MKAKARKSEMSEIEKQRQIIREDFQDYITQRVEEINIGVPINKKTIRMINRKI